MVAHLAIPPLSPPQPLPPEDPGTKTIPSHCPAMASDPLISDAIKPAISLFNHGPALVTGLTNPAAQPELCYPVKDEIGEDKLHRILTVNALTPGKK